MKLKKTLQDIFGENYFEDLDDITKYARVTYDGQVSKSSNKAAYDDSQSKPISIRTK